MQERKLMELAEAAGNIAIVGHVRPDGDCVGSCLAVCNYITEQYPEKTVDVYLETPPAKFSYLKQFERICSDPDTGNQYDLCICLDSGDRERLGKNVVYLNTAKTSICIDHHITNQGYAAANFVKADASATCELLYDFLDEEKISKDTPLVKMVKEWVDREYESGRVTILTNQELVTVISDSCKKLNIPLPGRKGAPALKETVPDSEL